MSPLNKRRWQNFKQNKRAIYSLLIFSMIFVNEFIIISKLPFMPALFIFYALAVHYEIVY